MLSSRTVNIVVITTTVVWALCVFIPLWAPNFNSGPISAVFMSIVGGALGFEATVARRTRKRIQKSSESDTTDDGNGVE